MHTHPHVAPSAPGSILIALREEACPDSRTGVSFRGYVKAAGRPLESLHLGGETEFEARARVTALYPTARIELEPAAAAPAPHGGACCASCAVKKPCESGCAAPRMRIFAGEAGEAPSDEPLFAVGEAMEEGSGRRGRPNSSVIGCGSCAAETPVTPARLRFETARKDVAGKYTMHTVGEEDLSPGLQALLAGGSCRGDACLPWYRVEPSDPATFQKTLEAAQKDGPVKHSSHLHNITKRWFARQKQECFLLISMDVHAQVQGIGMIARGSRDRVEVPIPDVLRLPIVDGAHSFVVAHNHPSGKHSPSKADDEITKAIKHAADAVGLNFTDHLVIGARGYYSYCDAGKI